MPRKIPSGNLEEFDMKKITRLISTLLVVTLGVGALASCAIDSDAEESLKYVSLRINPEIEMLADEDGEIVAASAINEDGEVVLSTVELEPLNKEYKKKASDIKDEYKKASKAVKQKRKNSHSDLQKNGYRLPRVFCL